jgi:HSP90 family molecular chaperone
MKPSKEAIEAYKEMAKASPASMKTMIEENLKATCDKYAGHEDRLDDCIDYLTECAKQILGSQNGEVDNETCYRICRDYFNDELWAKEDESKKAEQSKKKAKEPKKKAEKPVKKTAAQVEKENESLKYSVASLETDLAMSRRWRKCIDEMPNEKMEGEDFIVSNGFYSVVCEWRGYWNNEPFCGDKNCDEVKYWMPLPSAPKEGE